VPISFATILALDGRPPGGLDQAIRNGDVQADAAQPGGGWRGHHEHRLS
jgi:hypothetical protein